MSFHDATEISFPRAPREFFCLLVWEYLNTAGDSQRASWQGVLTGSTREEIANAAIKEAHLGPYATVLSITIEPNHL